MDERVYEKLRDAIMGGAFKPGQTLTLRGLAAAFGTSLMPVRSAVGRLAVEHALDTQPNKSITLPKLSSAQFDEVTEIRVALEPMAARLAAGTIDNAGIEKLSSLNKAMMVANADEYFRLNAEFHFGLYAHAGRPMLGQLIRGTWLRVGPLLQALESAHANLPTSNHDWTISALHRRDADDAAASIEADIRSAAYMLRELIIARDA